jgi:hypothetical protein
LGPKLPAPVNQPVKKTFTFPVQINVVPGVNAPITPTDIKFNYKIDSTSGGITTQAIPAGDLPTFDAPQGTTSLASPTTVNASYTCPAVPNTYSFTYTVSDPTGAANSGTITIPITCLGPKMTPPTPNPLTITAPVGSTASGSFSFGNCLTTAGPVDPGPTDPVPTAALSAQSLTTQASGTASDCAPLNFTVSGSDGLSVSSTANPLEAGGTATVNVSYACAKEGVFPATVTVKSDDAAKTSEIVVVNVKCWTYIGEIIGQYNTWGYPDVSPHPTKGHCNTTAQVTNYQYVIGSSKPEAPIYHDDYFPKSDPQGEYDFDITTTYTPDGQWHLDCDRMSITDLMSAGMEDKAAEIQLAWKVRNNLPSATFEVARARYYEGPGTISNLGYNRYGQWHITIKLASSK